MKYSVRKQILLSPTQEKLLEEASKRTGKSHGAVIRDLIEKDARKELNK